MLDGISVVYLVINTKRWFRQDYSILLSAFNAVPLREGFKSQKHLTALNCENFTVKIFYAFDLST